VPEPVRLRVSYLFSRECPSHEEGLQLLREAAERAGVPVAVEPVEVRGDEEAEALGFIGSPTYLAAGRDLFPAEGPGHAPRADACRIYARSGGRVGPLPELVDLARALGAAAASVPS
jgi:hypothetical protein